MSQPGAKPLILLAGASGYVGGRLLNVLQAFGYPVRCLARHPEFLAPRVSPATAIVKGDCLDPVSMTGAFDGVHTAYYLVHSMGSHGDFAEQDRTAAANFGAAARAADVQRIIYLGGLGHSGKTLSPHLRSRQETGEALRASGVPVIELRASIILGSGSLSFELIRALVERLPVMICPRWVRTPAQPIAIEDVLAYLLAAIDLPASREAIFEIGGADRVSYAGIMAEYARQRRLRRVMIPVPFLTPRLSSLWLGLTTPLYARIGRKLIESVENETTVHDERSLRTFSIRPMGLRQAIGRAMQNEDQEYAAPVGRMQSRRMDSGRLGAAYASGRAWSIRGRSMFPPPRSRHSPRFAASAAAPAGITRIGCGACVDSSTSYSAASACGAAAVIPINSR